MRACLLSGVLLLLRTTSGLTEDAEERKPRVEMDLAFDAEGQTLTITLSNVGEVPVLVDRELVLLVEVDLYDAKGKRIELESGKVLDDPSIEERRDRLVELAPGKSIERRIAFAEGVKRSSRGCLQMLLNDGRCVRVPVTGEFIDQLPEGRRVSRVEVSYGCHLDAWRATLRAWLGCDLEELGLVFTGPLRSWTDERDRYSRDDPEFVRALRRAARQRLMTEHDEPTRKALEEIVTAACRPDEEGTGFRLGPWRYDEEKQTLMRPAAKGEQRERKLLLSVTPEGVTVLGMSASAAAEEGE